ncbi:hypothetical protein B4098_2277 [Heyndrickxia coagulans]|uniref:Uncharacterized protein n=1 Tax=Heyndrickxia coagulans TaxID=1398 RepID=A0A150KBT2_HEYCO|nr:hypothetical protein B4098_2277 [Heyndrickxia coagulans]
MEAPFAEQENGRREKGQTDQLFFCQYARIFWNGVGNNSPKRSETN